MAMTDRQKDLLHSLMVVVGGGIILWAVTELVFPYVRRRYEGSDAINFGIGMAVIISVALILAAVLVVGRLRAGEVRGTWTIRTGDLARSRVRMRKGQVLEGTASEEGGEEFELRIMTTAQAALLLRGDRSASSLRDYTGRSHYLVKWTAPADGAYALVGDAYRKHKDRTVVVDLKVQRAVRKEASLEGNERKVHRALKRAGRGTPADIARRCGLSTSTTAKYLNSLKRKGLAVREGKGPGVRWSPK